MKTQLHWAGLAAVTALCGVSTCLGGPPFVTDDPEPVEYRHWEVYLASQFSRNADGWAGTLPQVEVNYGALPDLQLHLIAPYESILPRQGHSTSGYGDTELGLKYRFLHEDDTRPQAGVFPMLHLPTGDSDRGLGSGHTEAFLPVWVQKSWGAENRRWTTYGGGGYGINPGVGNRDWGLIGWLLQKRVSDQATLGAELYHQTPTERGGESDTAFNVGAVIDFTDRDHLLLSAGRSIDGPTRFQGYVAYQCTFGPE